MRVTVQRLPADRQGPDISDPLLTTIEAMTQRGRGEVNENAKSKMNVSGAMASSTDDIEPCSVIRVTDLEKGQYSAVVDSFSQVFDVKGKSFTASTSITFERDQDD